ncbi:MAG: aminotransferase class I/II-fold pyridoxal phosphate-dependent enzyme [Gemmatimonadota bacterium]
MHHSARAAKIEPFHAVEIYREALALSEHRNITILCIGEPDFPTPTRVIEAASRAALRGETHYTMPLGLPRLRRAISDSYLERYATSVPAERIGVTVGASGALGVIFAVLAEDGDEVLMADPGYPSNRAFLHCYGAVPKCIPVGPEQRFQLTADLVEASWGERTIGVMLASPANPTGMCLPDDELRRIHEVVAGRGGALIVDEIYHGLTYGLAPITAASLGGDVFVVNSFSKYYCMTGWRLGWLVAPERWMEHIERVQGQLTLCPPAPSQWAALAALEPESAEIYESQRATFRQRRDFLVPALNESGFQVDCMPDGAFYAYADISRYSNDSWQFCRDLLRESGIALTPGRDFGSHRANIHVRVSYTRPIEELAAAIDSLQRFARRRTD